LLNPVASSGIHLAAGAAERPAQTKLNSNYEVQVATTNLRDVGDGSLPTRSFLF
jgi:hypothetical protein